MLFNSQIFLLIFLPCTFLLFYYCKTIKSRTTFLLLASLIFYTWCDPRFFPILILSILFNWCIAYAIISKKYFLPDYWHKYIIYIAVALNLLALGFFKYCNFFGDIIFTALGKTPPQ